MKFAKKFKSAIALLMTFSLVFSMFSVVSSAQPIKNNKYDRSNVQTKEDSQRLLDAASAGDIDAQQYIASLKIFQKGIVDEALKSVKISPNNSKQTINFDDGSAITLEMKDISKEEFENSKRQLQSVTSKNYYKQIDVYETLLGITCMTLHTYVYWTGVADSRGWTYSRVTSMSVYQDTTWYPPFYANGTGCGPTYAVGNYPWADGVSNFSFGFYTPYYFGSIQHVNFEVGWNGVLTFTVS